MLLSVRTAVVLLALGAPPALACPDANSSEFPLLGRLILAGDYNLDPYRITVRGDGSSTLWGNYALGDCALEAEGLTGYAGDGIIDVRPDVVLDWLGGGQRLAFTIESQDDTLLVVQDPSGTWHFDDNGRGHNPLIVFDEPAIGEYVVFVGHHGTPRAYTTPAELIITQTGP